MLSLADVYSTLPLTIDAIVDLPARIAPERIALETETAAVTYGELVRRRDLLAAELRDGGLARFERCGVACGGAEAVVWTLALARAGCVAVPLSAQLAADAETLAETIGLAALVGRDGVMRRLRPARTCDADTTSHQRAGTFPIDLDPALALATSGSEGRRRFVMLQHHALLANIVSNVRALGLRDEDRTLVALPIVHAYALVGHVLSHLAVGATVRFWEGPILPALLARAIDRHAITTLATVPALARVLLASPSAPRPDATLRLIAIGAANAPAPLVDALRERFPGARIALTYGLTQAGPRVATRFVDGHAGDTACVGTPNPGVEIATADRDGARTLVVRSRALMRSYADDAFVEGEDGTLETGDLGTLRDGEVILTGRRSRTINRAGRLVAAERIERALASDVRVRAARVASEPHSFYGEVAVATVYVDAALLAHEGLDVELHARCARMLEHAECPQRIDVRAASDAMYDVKERAFLSLAGGAR